MSSFDPSIIQDVPSYSQRARTLQPSSPYQSSLISSAGGISREQQQQNQLVSSISSVTSNNQKSDAKSEQLVQQFYSKVAQIIVQSRVLNLAPTPSISSQQSRQTASRTRKSNKWFNLELVDSDVLRDDLKPWRAQLYTSNPAPPPLFIDILLDISNLHESQYITIYNSVTHHRHRISNEDLQYVDSTGKTMKKTRILIETWQLSLSKTVFPNAPPELPLVYKKSIVFFRSLYSTCRQLPAFRLAKRIEGRDPTSSTFKLHYRLSNGRVWDAAAIGLDQLITEKDTLDGLVEDNLGPIETPLGMLTLHLMFRSNCHFEASIPTSDSPLFANNDENFFRTSSSSNQFPPFIQPSRPSSGSSISNSQKQSSSLTRKWSESSAPIGTNTGGEVASRSHRLSLASTPSSDNYRMYIGSLKRDHSTSSRDLRLGSLSPQVVAFTPPTQMQFLTHDSLHQEPPFAQKSLIPARVPNLDTQLPPPVGSPPFSLHSQNSLDRSKRSFDLQRKSSITFYSSSPSSFELRSATPPRPPLLFTPSGSFSHPILTGLSGSPSPVTAQARLSSTDRDEDDIQSFLQETMEQSKLSLTSYQPRMRPSFSLPRGSSTRKMMDLDHFRKLRDEHSALADSILQYQPSSHGSGLHPEDPSLETQSLQILPSSFPNHLYNHPSSLPKHLPSQPWAASTAPNEDTISTGMASFSSGHKQNILAKIEEVGTEPSQTTSIPISSLLPPPPEAPFGNLETNITESRQISLWGLSPRSTTSRSGPGGHEDAPNEPFQFEKKPIVPFTEPPSSLLPLPPPPFALNVNRPASDLSLQTRGGSNEVRLEQAKPESPYPDTVEHTLRQLDNPSTSFKANRLVLRDPESRRPMEPPSVVPHTLGIFPPPHPTLLVSSNRPSDTIDPSLYERSKEYDQPYRTGRFSSLQDTTTIATAARIPFPQRQYESIQERDMRVQPPSSFHSTHDSGPPSGIPKTMVPTTTTTTTTGGDQDSFADSRLPVPGPHHDLSTSEEDEDLLFTMSELDIG